jgi:holo-[acyl-carrier protein] synthase
MIAGVGLDLVDIAGFRTQLDDPASQFAAGTFTDGERKDAERKVSGDPARHLAARFAAKEAFIKAWSVSRRGHDPALPSLDLREIEVVADAFDRPTIVLHGAVARACGRGRRLHLSLSHDGPVAAAVVVLEVP